MSAADDSPLQALEERAFNAWPARQTVFFEGWVMRLSDGFTKRANSVNAGAPGLRFDGVQQAAEALYGSQSLPAVFRLSPLAPADADRRLEAAGYTFFDPSWVARAALDAAVPDTAVGIAAAPDQAWLDGFAQANGVPPSRHAVHHAMVRSIALPCGFATLHDQGEPVGFALAVLERGAVGFYDVVVAPRRRGQGLGRRLMLALMHWGASQGAAWGYLQVRQENEAARRLYAALGFADVYRYHYRMPPAASVKMPGSATGNHTA
ncbi:GNAT family N-acetyltransferase [Xylophilus rhododendri]|uniref:GNAT family N-acetyltransferase n=1 Tax=Xylophilus rhododendri TaxID=2697032 RepID=A0A857J360_9BURK|nr:GNAT family N-acetyltransferase [Xylophilus rhododendri]QHI98097.1 GNAT family N-acetyltransferase [Xylophilus rhododendri]